MKQFTIKGPKTSTTFKIRNDEMLQWSIIKIKDYESQLQSNSSKIYNKYAKPRIFKKK